MKFMHIYPTNDLKPHDTESSDCECLPFIDVMNQIIIHNSWDGREIIEQAEVLINEQN